LKLPKTVRIFCPFCKKHTSHDIETVKKRTRRKMAEGQRRFERKLKGYGSFPKSKPDYEKPTKRMDLRYKCKECGKRHTKGKGFRSKKFELVKV